MNNLLIITTFLTILSQATVEPGLLKCPNGHEGLRWTNWSALRWNLGNGEKWTSNSKKVPAYDGGCYCDVRGQGCLNSGLGPNPKWKCSGYSLTENIYHCDDCQRETGVRYDICQPCAERETARHTNTPTPLEATNDKGIFEQTENTEAAFPLKLGYKLLGENDVFGPENLIQVLELAALFQEDRSNIQAQVGRSIDNAKSFAARNEDFRNSYDMVGQTQGGGEARFLAGYGLYFGNGGVASDDAKQTIATLAGMQSQPDRYDQVVKLVQLDAVNAKTTNRYGESEYVMDKFCHDTTAGMIKQAPIQNKEDSSLQAVLLATMYLDQPWASKTVDSTDVKINFQSVESGIAQEPRKINGFKVGALDPKVRRFSGWSGPSGNRFKCVAIEMGGELPDWANQARKLEVREGRQRYRLEAIWAQPMKDNEVVADPKEYLKDPEFQRLVLGQHAGLNESEHQKRQAFLPSFEIGSKFMDMKSALREVGLGGFLDTSLTTLDANGNLHITAVGHEAKLIVSHDGVRFAAASAAESTRGGGGGPPPGLYIDGPFVFSIVMHDNNQPGSAPRVIALASITKPVKPTEARDRW